MPLVSEAPARHLVIEESEPATLTIYGSEFAVRIGADLDVDVMAEILLLSTEFRRHGMKKPEKVAEWAKRAKALVLKIIEQENPDPHAFEAVRARAFSPTALFQMLTFLSANPNGAPAEVAEALTEGLPDVESDEPVDPTSSTPRSRSRRSRSARHSTSGRAGGEASDGASSVSTSPTPTAAL